MKQIPLTKGQFALVDNEDYEFLMQWKWQASFDKKSNQFYAVTTKRSRIFNATIRMNRFIMSATDNKIFVDHIDRNTLNNQRSNLRIATHSQNGANRKSHKNSSSKYLGVSWKKDQNKWAATIQKDRNSYRLGVFSGEADAAKAYDNAAVKLHGEFANLNFK